MPLKVLAQLRKFARTLKQIREAVAPSSRSRAEVPAPRASGLDYASSGKDRLPKPNPNMSLSEMLRTDITGMDATVSGGPATRRQHLDDFRKVLS